jgi:O-succinylbenzoic acid--CoA ligase
MDSGSTVDWSGVASEALLNPKLPESERKKLTELVSRFPQPAHIWMTSSGSSADSRNSLKLIALSKMAFLRSAEAVNRHLQSGSKDVWIQTLPRFHVGGLSIEARAHLSGARLASGCTEFKWSPEFFVKRVQEEKGTLTSLVPTQVYDLVERGLRAPLSLRAAIVGGGAINQDLLSQARKLGWPLLPSYGLTECCSQVATAVPDSESTDLEILSHINARLSGEGLLEIQSESLLTGYAQWVDSSPQWVDPKKEGWLTTEDLAEIRGGFLFPRGRSSDYVKILGEGVHLRKLNQILEATVFHESPELKASWALAVLPDSRLGSRLVFVFDKSFPRGLAEKLIADLNGKVAPFERVKELTQVEKIPRTELWKVATGQLHEMLKK